MSDTENEKEFISQKSVETEKRFSRVTKERVQKSLTELKTPRQKFCPRWEEDFPWLRADRVDESLGYCVICRKILVCKKSHLERHEKSYKHQRLQCNSTDVEMIRNNETDGQNTEFLECGKKEIDDFEFESTIEVDPDTVETDAAPVKPKRLLVQRHARGSNQIKSPREERTPQKTKLSRFKLLKRIDRDRQELNEYYYARQRDQVESKSIALTSLPQQTLATVQPISVTGPQQPRDSFDLFFESVSASVKTLPPKLAAEVKSKVSQIMAEFELRAICEREAYSNISTTVDSGIVLATTNHHEALITNAIPTNGVDEISTNTVLPHIVYTFKPKLDPEES